MLSGDVRKAAAQDASFDAPRAAKRHIQTVQPGWAERARELAGSRHTSAMSSTSTRTFFGSCLAATQERAGRPVKYRS